MRRVLFATLFLLLLASVSAVSFDVSVFPSERSIGLNESAEFEVELTHDSPVEELFEVFSTDVTWDVRPDKTLRAPPGTPLKAKLFVRPLNVNPGAYNLPVTFKRAGSLDRSKEFVYVEIVSPYAGDATYLPAVRGVADVDKRVDPRDPMVIKLSLENQNRRELGTVDVKVRSHVVNEDYSTSLGPLEKKTLTFEAELDPRTPPQKDELHVSIIVPEQEKAFQFDLFPIAFEVIPYGGVETDVEGESAFLKHTELISLHNDGNKAIVYEYRKKAWFGKRLFASGVPEPRTEGGMLVWDVPLKPGEMAQVVAVFNYRPLFWLALVILVVLGAYYKFRSPIAVRKTAAVARTQEGGIAEVKVVLELVNRTNKVVREVKVMDLAPQLADVVEEFENTLEPKLVPHKGQGTLVKWELDVMEPKEQRILVYRMRTRLGVLGGMSLPVAAAKFEVDGHLRETVSNKPVIRQ